MNLSALIETAISLKQGNKEFILYRFGSDGSWLAGIGNSTKVVSMLETYPDIYANDMATPEEAVLKLIELLKA